MFATNCANKQEEHLEVCEGSIPIESTRRKAMPDIKHSIQISAAPEAVYQLVATAEGLGQWWATDVAEADGAVALGFFNRTTVYRLRPMVDHSPSEAEWLCETGDEWNGTRLVFRLEGTGSGTTLRFAHAGWRSETDYFTNCNTTWGELMYRLKAVAQGNPLGPLFRISDMAY
jgi:uncharacterized protein YndB with AHSA1/START domain